MQTGQARAIRRIYSGVVGATCLALVILTPATAQFEQRVSVRIKDFTFITKQAPLQLNVPTLITIYNEDLVRHDFGTTMFQGVPTRIESGGVVSYGRDLGGVFIDPGRGAAIRFILDRPGRYRFKCSIHPEMEGEFLMLQAGTA